MYVCMYLYTHISLALGNHSSFKLTLIPVKLCEILVVSFLVLQSILKYEPYGFQSNALLFWDISPTT